MNQVLKVNGWATDHKCQTYPIMQIQGSQMSRHMNKDSQTNYQRIINDLNQEKLGLQATKSKQ